MNDISAFPPGVRDATGGMEGQICRNIRGANGALLVVRQRPNFFDRAQPHRKTPLQRCIDWLSAGLGRLARRKIPSPYVRDQSGQLRLITKNSTFPSMMDAAFNQLRQHGKHNVAVAIRLLEQMREIALHARRREDRNAVFHHCQLILEDAPFRVTEKRKLLPPAARPTRGFLVLSNPFTTLPP